MSNFKTNTQNCSVKCFSHNESESLQNGVKACYTFEKLLCFLFWRKSFKFERQLALAIFTLKLDSVKKHRNYNMPADPWKMCTNTFIYQIWRRQIHILNKVGNGEKMRSGSLQMLTLVTQESVMGAEGKNTELLGDKEWRNWKGSIFTRGARQNTQSWKSASIKMKKRCRVSGFRGEYNMKMDKEWFSLGLSGNSCHFRTHKYQQRSRVLCQ